MNGGPVHALLSGQDNGGIVGAAIVLVVVMILGGLARKYSAGVARVGGVLVTLLVIAVAVSIVYRGPR